MVSLTPLVLWGGSAASEKEVLLWRCSHGHSCAVALPGCLWSHIPLLVKFLLAGLFPSPCASAHIREQGSPFPPGLSCGFCHK